MAMMEDKVCVITGGAGSIGLAGAKILLENGAKVMLVSHDEDNLSRAVRLFDAGLDRLGTIKADVASSPDTQ